MSSNPIQVCGSSSSTVTLATTSPGATSNRPSLTQALRGQVTSPILPERHLRALLTTSSFAVISPVQGHNDFGGPERPAEPYLRRRFIPLIQRGHAVRHRNLTGASSVLKDGSVGMIFGRHQGNKEARVVNDGMFVDTLLTSHPAP